MAFTIPNYGDATFPDQAEPDSGDFAIITAATNQTGVVSGCAVTAQGVPDMTVAVASGTIAVAATTAAVTGTNVTITAAHGTHPRFDLIVSDSSGTLSATAGTPSGNPVYPAIPANSVVLATVYVPANDTAINSTQITDKRVTIPTPTTATTIHRCRLTRAADLTSVSSGTITYIPWTSEEFDNNTFHDNSTNNTRMTFNTTGLYLVTAHLYYVGNGTVEMNLRLNGTTNKRYARVASATQESVTITTMYDATATDYLEVGINPSVTGTVESDWSYFECHLITT